jgi:hypothetical protein
MTYHKPELILLEKVFLVICGNFGKWFLIFPDATPIVRRPALTIGAYEADE